MLFRKRTNQQTRIFSDARTMRVIKKDSCIIKQSEKFNMHINDIHCFVCKLIKIPFKQDAC